MAPKDARTRTGDAPSMHPSRMSLVDINRVGPRMGMHPSRMGLVDINRTGPGIGMHPSRMKLVDINRENPNMMHASRGGFTNIRRENTGKINCPHDASVDNNQQNPMSKSRTIAETVEEKEPCPPEPGTEGDEGAQDPSWFFMSLGLPEGPVTWPEL